MGAKGWFDFLTVAWILLAILTFTLGGAWGVLLIIVLIIYSMGMVILGVRKSEKISYGFAIFIGSVLVPGLGPTLYYLTYLRKKIGQPGITQPQQAQQPVQQPQQPMQQPSA